MTSVPSTPLGPIIGREPELARVRALFDAGERLVTLLGPPGIGKTRLAVALAQAEADAVWVELAHARGAEDVASRIAFALDVRTSWVELEPGPSPDLPWLDELAWALETRPEVVLVLDEAEHVAAALAPIISSPAALMITRKS
ncbi:MAG: ATP-binding protein [Myxococcales bacterium]|nr:ATP-binding protein [Myxococcales bacterium]